MTQDIIKAAKEDKRVIVAEILTDEMKKQILELELKRLNEPIPVINKSLQEAFDKEQAMVIVIEKPKEDVPIEEQIPTLTLQTDSGKIIGEEIYDPEELELMREDNEAYFISEHFVTFPNMAVAGEKQFFVVGEIYNVLESEDRMKECVKSMIISVPSTHTDSFIKDCYELSHEEKIATMIVGFDEKE